MKEIDTALDSNGIRPDGDVEPRLRAIVGVKNKIRFLLGKEPVYDDETLSKIVAGEMSRVTLTDRSGKNQTIVPMYSWRTVYKMLRIAGLSPRTAQKQTSRHILLLD